MRVLVTGARGLLGREVVRQLGERGHDAIACDRVALDITDRARAHDVLQREAPEVVMHCAGFTNVDAAEGAPDDAVRVNVDGTANVARAAAEVGARFVYVSTDYVFDGSACEPYAPRATPNPLSTYGRSKLGGEEAARLAGDWLVARVSWVYGRGGTNFGSRVLERARAGETIRAFTDMTSAPTWVCDAADVLLRLVECGAPTGVYHANNAGGTTWYEFARAAIALAGVEADVEPASVAAVSLPAPRPRFSAMDVTDTERVAGPVRSWQDAMRAAVAAGL